METGITTKMRQPALCVLVCFLILALGAGPSIGGSARSGAWVLLSLVGVEGGMVTIDYSAGDGASIAHAFLIRQGDGVSYAPMSCVGPPSGLASAEVLGSELVHVGPTPIIRLGGGGCAAGFGLPAGEPVWFVGLAGGDITAWSYTVHNAAFTEIGRGDALALDPSDFAPVGAQVRASAASAYAAAGERRFEISHELVGIVGDPIGPTAVLAIETPIGDELCRCVFPDPNEAQPSVHGAGEYTISLTGVGARVLHGPLAIVADVPIPRSG